MEFTQVQVSWWDDYLRWSFLGEQITADRLAYEPDGFELLSLGCRVEQAWVIPLSEVI